MDDSRHLIETRAGGSMGGHDPRAHGKIRYIVRAFGTWAQGQHRVCTKRLLAEHPEVVHGNPKRAAALCAWLKDQWAGTTKWRGPDSNPAQKAENKAIMAQAQGTAYARFTHGAGELMTQPDHAALREWEVEPFELTLGEIDAFYDAVVKRNMATMESICGQAIAEVCMAEGDGHAVQFLEDRLRDFDMLTETERLRLLYEADWANGVIGRGYVITEGVYSAAKRRRYATVRGDRFPISDAAHARAALARLNQAKPPLSPAERAKVIRKAYRYLAKGR